MAFQVKFTDNSSLVLGQMKSNVNAALAVQGENLRRRVRPYLLSGVDLRLSVLTQGGLIGATLCSPGSRSHLSPLGPSS